MARLKVDPNDPRIHPRAKALRKQYQKPHDKPVVKRSTKIVTVEYLGRVIRLPLRVDGSVIMPDGSVNYYKQLTVNSGPRTR